MLTEAGEERPESFTRRMGEGGVEEHVSGEEVDRHKKIGVESQEQREMATGHRVRGYRGRRTTLLHTRARPGTRVTQEQGRATPTVPESAVDGSPRPVYNPALNIHARNVICHVASLREKVAYAAKRLLLRVMAARTEGVHACGSSQGLCTRETLEPESWRKSMARYLGLLHAAGSPGERRYVTYHREDVTKIYCIYTLACCRTKLASNTYKHIHQVS